MTLGSWVTAWKNRPEPVLGDGCLMAVGSVLRKDLGPKNPALTAEGRKGSLETTALRLTLKAKWTGISCFKQERSQLQARPDSTQRHCCLLGFAGTLTLPVLRSQLRSVLLPGLRSGFSLCPASLPAELPHWACPPLYSSVTTHRPLEKLIPHPE